ncbi:MAG: hypothetical protein WKF36_03645 [Candidatus Nitrosocosmicus sp.]
MKFSIKKRIISDIKNRYMKFQDISLENKPPSEIDNEENNGEIKKTADNNTVETNKSEFLGNSSRLETNEEFQVSKDPKEEDEEVTCHHCKEKIDEEWKEPHWKWNLDKNTKFCMKCYGTKEIEYEKLMNYCVVCSSKLKFIRYNPKPEWKLRGQLCRVCWDSQNRKHKGDK